MFERFIKMLRIYKRIKNKPLNEFIIIQCESSLKCTNCGEKYTYARLLGTVLTMEHEKHEKCICNYKKYNLVP